MGQEVVWPRRSKGERGGCKGGPLVRTAGAGIGASCAVVQRTIHAADVARAMSAQNEKWETAAVLKLNSPEKRRPEKIPTDRDVANNEHRSQGGEKDVRGPEGKKKSIGPSLPHQSDGPEVKEKEDGLFLPKKIDGPGLSQAQIGKPRNHEVFLGAHDIISPLKDIMEEAREERLPKPRGGPRNLPKGPRRIEQRITKALGVKKKIEHSPFRGCRIHKHAFVVKEDPVPGKSAVTGGVLPSSSKTGPDEGRNSKKFEESVVKRKPPGAA